MTNGMLKAAILCPIMIRMMTTAVRAAINTAVIAMRGMTMNAAEIAADMIKATGHHRDARACPAMMMKKEAEDIKAAMQDIMMTTADMGPMTISRIATAAAHSMTTTGDIPTQVRAVEMKENMECVRSDIMMMTEVSDPNMMSREPAVLERAEALITMMIAGPAMMMTGLAITAADNHMMKIRIMEEAWKAKDGAITKAKTHHGMMMTATVEGSITSGTRTETSVTKTAAMIPDVMADIASIGARRETRETATAAINGIGKMTADGMMKWIQASGNEANAAISATGRRITAGETGIEPR
jgi:hypothetical protein